VANPEEHWKKEPEEHDYPAALAYLTLVLPEETANGLVAALRAAPLGHQKAKDLLRASGLALLTDKNAHVAADLHKVDNGEALSPVLLVRGDALRGTALIVADGYHRICASYQIDENADIPCRIADLPAG
jgi:hypothetical protein